jgi:hypothetical protein
MTKQLKMTESSIILVDGEPARWFEFCRANADAEADDPGWLAGVKRALEETGEHYEDVGGDWVKIERLTAKAEMKIERLLVKAVREALVNLERRGLVVQHADGKWSAAKLS